MVLGVAGVDHASSMILPDNRPGPAMPGYKEAPSALTNRVPYEPELHPTLDVSGRVSLVSEVPGGKSGNGTAIGVATVVAGVLGTLASSLFSRKESRRERARKQIEQRIQVLEHHTSQAVEQLGKVVEGLNVQVSGDSRRTQRKAKHVGKAARRQAAELDREAVRLQSLERVNQLGHDGSRRVRELARQLNDRTADVIADNRTHLPEWRMRTSQSASDAIGKGSALVHQAVDSAPGVRDKVSASASGAASTSSDAAHRMRERAPEVLDRVSKTLGHVVDQGTRMAEQVRESAPDAIDKASKSAHDAFGQAQGRAPEVREWAHDVAADASQRAHQLADQARTHAPAIGAQVASALHSAQDGARPVLDDVASRAARLVDGAKEAGSHASESLLPEVQHRVDAVAGRAKSQGQASASTLAALGTTAGEKLSHSTEAIEQQSKAAAAAAGRGTKDGGSLVAWSLAAAAIVYYAFLNEEQRVKAKESGQRIVAEVKEVYRDIRGYDEEFT